MGMSASQARLLYLTAQMNNLSLKGQQVSDAKIRLSMDTEEIQQKYINALNATRLFVDSNIFTGTGSYINSEYISLENLKSQGLMVSDGSKVLGYSYQQVLTGNKTKVKVGEEDDLTKPIYPTKKVPADGFLEPSTTGIGDVDKMYDIVNSTGLGVEDLQIQSYYTTINGDEVELNTIKINSQKGFEAIYEILLTEAYDGTIDNSLQQNYILDTDVDLSKYESYGIAYFQGVFDGNGHTITGLQGEQGLFRDLYGVAKNINIDGAKIESESDALGGIAGYLGEGGIIENCNVTNLELTCTLKNADYKYGYDSERAGVGGVVGYNYGSIRNTSAEGSISIPNADNSFGYIGGFVGANINPQYGDVNNVIENCYSDVNIYLGTGADYSNSINGFIGDDTYESIVNNCISLGGIYTASGDNINGTDLANWGPVIESDVKNLIALDTRNNNNVLYWENTKDPKFTNGSTTQPASLSSVKENDINVWLTPGTAAYDDQTQGCAKDNNLPVLNLTALQEAGQLLVKGENKVVPDYDAEPIGYKQKPIYVEVDEYATELVEDPGFSISSMALEQGLRSGALQLVKESPNGGTQAISLNGVFVEVVSLNTCSTIVDRAEEDAAAKAEAEYNKSMTEIQAKDKRYEMDQKKIDTEYNALAQEEESMKTVLSKNVDRSFKAFG